MSGIHSKPRNLTAVLIVSLLSLIITTPVFTAELPPLPLTYHAPVPPQQTKGKLRLYLVIGSSMAADITRQTSHVMTPGDADIFVPHPRVLYWNDQAWHAEALNFTTMGAAQYFARAMAEAAPDEYVGIVSIMIFATTLRRLEPP